MRKPKLIVTGHGRHGKDTVCEILRDGHGFKFVSSSFWAAERLVFPKLRESHGYQNVQECYADRHTGNNRALWFDLITSYNPPEDRAKMMREMFKTYDVYCGIRNHEELVAGRKEGLFDLCLWIDRSEHQPPEDTSSMTITPDMCDVFIDNNRDLGYTELQVLNALKSRI